MNYSFFRIIIFLSFLIAVSSATLACGSALKPEQTPTRVTVNFMKAVGRNDITAAQEFVSPASASMIPEWRQHLIFPDISEPPTPDDESKIDRFIGTLYMFNVMDETETTAKLYIAFTASDSLMGFPSVADNPMTPVSASWTVMLSRSPLNEGGTTDYTDWIIDSIETGPR